MFDAPFPCRSLSQLGGVQVFLMLCAKVIEITSDSLGPSSTLMERQDAELIQSNALQSLLDLRRADTKRHEEFFSQNIAGMLHKVNRLFGERRYFQQWVVA